MYICVYTNNRLLRALGFSCEVRVKVIVELQIDGDWSLARVLCSWVNMASRLFVCARLSQNARRSSVTVFPRSECSGAAFTCDDPPFQNEQHAWNRWQNTALKISGYYLYPQLPWIFFVLLLSVNSIDYSWVQFLHTMSCTHTIIFSFHNQRWKHRKIYLRFFQKSSKWHSVIFRRLNSKSCFVMWAAWNLFHFGLLTEIATKQKSRIRTDLK